MFQMCTFSAGSQKEAEKQANTWMAEQTKVSSFPKTPFRLVSVSQLFDGNFYYITIAYTTIL